MNVARTLILFVVTSALALGQAQDRAFPLPKDPKATILSLDYRGGLTPPVKAKGPTFSVHADGTIVWRDVFLHQEPAVVKGKLGKKEVQDLLRFVIRTQRFGEWDEGVVRKKLAAQKDAVPSIVDAASTVITLNIPGMKKTAQWYALGYVAARTKGVPELTRLEAVRHELQHRCALLRAGGKKAVAPRVKELNAELARKLPEVKARFRVEDLTHLSCYRKGARSYNFQRALNEKERLWGSVVTSPGGEPQIRVQTIAAR